MKKLTKKQIKQQAENIYFKDVENKEFALTAFRLCISTNTISFQRPSISTFCKTK